MCPSTAGELGKGIQSFGNVMWKSKGYGRNDLGIRNVPNKYRTRRDFFELLQTSFRQFLELNRDWLCVLHLTARQFHDSDDLSPDSKETRSQKLMNCVSAEEISLLMVLGVNGQRHASGRVCVAC